MLQTKTFTLPASITNLSPSENDVCCNLQLHHRTQGKRCQLPTVSQAPAARPARRRHTGRAMPTQGPGGSPTTSAGCCPAPPRHAACFHFIFHICTQLLFPQRGFTAAGLAVSPPPRIARCHLQTAREALAGAYRTPITLISKYSTNINGFKPTKAG